MRRTRSRCCAHAAIGQATAPPKMAMNSRRLMPGMGFLNPDGQFLPVYAPPKG
jgi:hypothetical protein